MLEAHYLQLSKGLNLQLGVQVEMTLQQVAACLYCTERNANLLLKRMRERGWLDWVPGRGRGNRSRLTLLIDPESLLLAHCEKLLSEGKVGEAYEWLREEEISEKGRAQWLQLLSKQFGYRSEQGDESQRDLLRFPFYRVLQTIDPYFSAIRTENQLLRHIVEGLVVWSDEHNRWEGRIAHEWEVDESRTEYVFYLRKGVRFHNGQELTSADVKVTFDLLLDPTFGSPNRDMYDCLQAVEVVGRYAVRFLLHKPHPLFVNLLGATCASIQPKERATDDHAKYARFPIGTGPFQVVRNDEQQFVLEVFADYHQGRPFLDRVELWVVPDLEELATVRQLGGQDIVFFPGSAPKSLPSYIQKVDQVMPGCFMSVWNFNISGPHHEIKFRKAFALLIDKVRMIEELGGLRARPAYGLIERGDLVDIPMQLSAEERIKEAKKLLAECGYQGEEVTVLTYKLGANEENVAWIAARVAEAGIRLKIDVRGRDVFVRKELMDEVHLVCVGWVAGEDEELSLYDQYKAQSNAFRNPLGPDMQKAVDEKLDDLMQIEDPLERQQAFLAIERWLEEEAIVQFLYHSRVTNSYHPHLRGVMLSVQGHIDFRKLWWKA